MQTLTIAVRLLLITPSKTPIALLLLMHLVLFLIQQTILEQMYLKLLLGIHLLVIRIICSSLQTARETISLLDIQCHVSKTNIKNISVQLQNGVLNSYLSNQIWELLQQALLVKKCHLVSKTILRMLLWSYRPMQLGTPRIRLNMPILCHLPAANWEVFTKSLTKERTMLF